MIKEILKPKFWIFFWGFLLLMFTINIIEGFFAAKHLWWHLFLHAGIIFFSFLIFTYSLKLPKKAMKFISVGAGILIIVESVLFLSHIFEVYYLINLNFIVWAFGIVGIFMLMKGFRGLQNDRHR